MQSAGNLPVFLRNELPNLEVGQYIPLMCCYISTRLCGEKGKFHPIRCLEGPEGE